jgi:hypothetical protein
MGFFDKLKALLGAGKETPDAAAKCKKPPPPKHFVGVRLRHKDDKSDVLATSCIIHNGAATLNGGPLAVGKLESRDIDAGSYEVSFPDIHADEWSAE